MGVITLLTDFGTRDEYVGAMKGVILSVHPDATVVDISHEVDAHDLRHAGALLMAAFPYFPAQTIHIVVVDPGVGGRRAAIALSCRRHCFVGPDNGVFSPLLDGTGPVEIVRLENPEFFLDCPSRTFHGRDIFAPVAARLSAGLDLARLGPSLGPDEVVRLPLPTARISDDGQLVGEVVSIDRFGNLVTNIGRERLDSFLGGRSADVARFVVGRCLIQGLSSSYDSVQDDQPLAIIGSRGAVEIAVNRASARSRLAVARGDAVRVVISGKLGRRGSRR